MKVTQKLKFVLRWVEDIVGKGENAGNTTAFSPFPPMFFSWGYFLRVVNKSRDCVVKSFMMTESLTLLANVKYLDWSKFKAFADHKINAILRQKLALGWVENIVGKGKKCS